MKLERSDTWTEGRPVWRVTFGKVSKWQNIWPDLLAPIWGPFCYTRRDAVWQWFKCWIGWVWRHSICTWRGLTLIVLFAAIVTWVVALVTKDRVHVLAAVIMQLTGGVFMAVHAHRRSRIQ